jgi:hypothetical protein
MQDKYVNKSNENVYERILTIKHLKKDGELGLAED